MYGMHVSSEFVLPFPAIPTPPDIVPAWQFRLGNPSWNPQLPDDPPDAEIVCCCGPTRASVMLHRSAEGTLIQIPPYGRFRIAPDGRRVDVWPDRDVDEHSIGSVLAASVSVIVLQTLGYPTLNAMAFAFRGHAVAILSPRDQSASVRQTALEQGGVLLAEEALALLPRASGIYAAPGVPLRNFRVSRGQCRSGRPEQIGPPPACAKGSLLPLAESAAPLRAIYVVGQSDATADCGSKLRPLPSRDAVFALLRSTSGRELMAPRDLARSLQLYARLVANVPVRVVADAGAIDYCSAAACSAS